MQIEIGAIIHRRIKRYAKAARMTVAAVAEEAINEWMDCHGDPVLRRLKEQPVESQKAHRKCRQPERTNRRIGPSGTEKVVPFPTGKEA